MKGYMAFFYKLVTIKDMCTMKIRFITLLCWINIIVIAFPSGLSYLFPAEFNYAMLAVGVLLILLDIHYFSKTNKIILDRLYWVILFFCLWLLLSTFLNGGDFFRACKFSYQIFLAYIFAAFFFRYDFWETISKLALWGEIIIFLNFLTLVYYYPNGIYNVNQSEYSIIGIINAMEAYWLPFVMFIFIDMIKKNKHFKGLRLLWIFILVFIPSFLYSSDTNIVIISLTLIMGIVALYFKNFYIKSSRIYIIWLVTILAITVFLIYTDGSSIPIIGNNPSITSRILLWRRSLDMIIEKPLLGYGISETDNVVFYNQWRNYSSHNFFLMIGIWGGIPLFLMYVYMLGTCVKKIFLQNDMISRVMKIIFALFLVYSIVEINNSFYLFLIALIAMIHYKQYV